MPGRMSTEENAARRHMGGGDMWRIPGAGQRGTRRRAAAVVELVRIELTPSPQLGSDKSVLVATWFQGFPDLLAFRAHREALRIAAGYPYLAAECDHRGTHHHRLGQLVLGYVVGEALVVALLDFVIGAFLGAFVDNGLGTRTRLLTHVGQSRQRGAN